MRNENRKYRRVADDFSYSFGKFAQHGNRENNKPVVAPVFLPRFFT